MVQGSKCCGRSAIAQAHAKTSEHHVHGHHHGHAQSHHEHPPAPGAGESEQAPANNEHDGQNCPCGKHHASLVATAVTNGIQLKAAELPALTWHVVVAMLPVLSEFDADYASMIAQNRPATLYGREILRAYQIMRC